MAIGNLLNHDPGCALWTVSGTSCTCTFTGAVPAATPQHAPYCAIDKWPGLVCTCTLSPKYIGKDKPKLPCDCGGAKARTTHSSWCSAAVK